MPQNYTGRVVLIAVILLAAIWSIFPRGDIRHPNLKPGIDMVGGTSLLYEIKQPAGGWHGSKSLAEEVMETRKKLFADLMRVHDEIQQAAAKKDTELQAKKEIEFDALKVQIEETNLTASSLEAMLTAKPETKNDKIAELKKRFADFPERVA